MSVLCAAGINTRGRATVLYIRRKVKETQATEEQET